MRRENRQQRVRQRWTWDSKEKHECVLHHSIECRALLCPRDGSAALLLWERFIPAATVSTEDAGNLHHITPITSLHFLPVQNIAECQSDSLALLCPDWQTQQHLVARRNGGSNMKVQTFVLMSWELDGETFKLSLKFQTWIVSQCLFWSAWTLAEVQREYGWNNTYTRMTGYGCCSGQRMGSTWLHWGDHCILMTEIHIYRVRNPSLLWHHPSRYAPGYLNGTLHDECCELRHHKVHTFEAGLFEFEDLLFYYRLESQVRGEEPCSERSRSHIAFGFGDRERGIGRQ